MDPVEETTAFYERIAGRYAAQWVDSPVMDYWRERFLGFFRGPGRILDVGCGPGRDARAFVEAGYGVVGIDLSAELLKIAREVAPGVVFMQMDMRALTFPPNSFGGIWASASLIHVPKRNVLATLRGFYRALEPSNGLLYLAVKEGDGIEWKVDGDGGRLTVFYQSCTLQSLARRAGFEVIEIERSEGHVTFLNLFARKPPG